MSLNFHVICFFHMLHKEDDWFYSLNCDINALSKLNKLAEYSGLQSTAWKVSKYGVISGPYFPVFGMNRERYNAELFLVHIFLYAEWTLRI